jgi:hypothetical protein
MRLIVAAALIASGDALNVVGMSRRAAFAKAAALIPLVPLAAFAELKQASDAEVYERADEGKLNSARVVERAKAGKLVDGSSATCDELIDILAIDRRALQFETDKLDSLPDDSPQRQTVAKAQKALEAQIKKLKDLEKTMSCPGLKQKSDEGVYRRADENRLGWARVIERARRASSSMARAPPAPSWRRLSASTRRPSGMSWTSSRSCPTTPSRRRSSRTPRRPSRPRSSSSTPSAGRRVASLISTEACGAHAALI